MSTARSRSGVPDLVTSLYGVVVAVLSGTVGIVGHGLAMGHGLSVSLPTATAALAVAAGAGALTTTSVRRVRHEPVLAVGLLLGQLSVHLVLAADHVADGAGSPPGHAGHAHAELVTGVAGTQSGPWSPEMLVAHGLASLVALALVLATGRALSWVAARVTVVTRALHSVRVPRSVSARSVPVVGTRWHLVAAGGTRAPPAVA